MVLKNSYNCMQNLSEEEKIILQLSSPAATHNILNSSNLQLNSANSFVNQDKLLEISIQNGVAALMYKRNKELGLLPESLLKKFKTMYFFLTARNLKQLHETMNILALLLKHSVNVIPLKGAISAENIFKDIGVYPSGDIDILVHPAQLDKASEILCKEGGYVKVQEIKEEDLRASHYHLLFNKNNYHLEVHWNLVKRYFSISPDFWWQDITLTSNNDIEIMELTTEKYLLYLIFRLFDHGFYPLKFFVLPAALINEKQKEIDWEKLINYASRYKMKKLVCFTLALLHDLFQINIPSEIMKKKIIGYQIFKKIILSGIFSGIKRAHMRMMLYTLLLDQKTKIPGIFLGRIFPSKSELRLRYNLEPDSKIVYCYYFLNPFLLLRKN